MSYTQITAWPTATETLQLEFITQSTNIADSLYPRELLAPYTIQNKNTFMA